MKLWFIVILIFSSTAHAVSIDTTPRFLLGVGMGLCKSGQNVDGATSSTGMGLSATAAYSPIEHWFAGFDIYTFSPISGVRASNYMFSALYHMQKFTVGALLGIQAVNDGRANGSNSDPLTGNTLAESTSSFSYGIKASYNKLWDIKRDDFNIGVSPVLFIIKASGKQNFNQILLMFDFRVWGY